MDWWQVIVLSVVEGLTEFLPVSSTGHLIMAAKLLEISQTEFVKSFEVVIQLGAILSIALLYAKRLVRNTDELKRVMTAFIPTGVLGFWGYRLIKTVLLGNELVTVAALFIGGMMILILDNRFDQRSKENKKISDLSYGQAGLLGVIQALAVVPGVSRALVTIWGGMGMGMTKKNAVEMSFLLAVPTMAAASGYDLLKSGWVFTGQEWTILGLGFVGSAIAAAVTVKWFLNVVERKGMKFFGWYRMVAAGAFAAIIFL